MTPNYHVKPPPTFIDELNLAQSLTVSSSSSSFGRTFFSSDQDIGEPCRRELVQSIHVQPEKREESSDVQDDHDDDHNSQKWRPSKIRIIRKMMRSNQIAGDNHVAMNSAQKFGDDQKQFPSPVAVESDTSIKGSSYRNTDNAIRVCSDCNTTKTPLWRSGPRGPKSLCNACGIRQRKARRALAAEAAAANGTILPAATPSIKIKVKSKMKRSNNDHRNEPQFKRGCKNTLPANSSPAAKNNNLCYEDFTSSILSKHYSAYQRVFPQDEREAAILLMALSYGLIHG